MYSPITDAELTQKEADSFAVRLLLRQKSLAEFAARRRQGNEIIFSRDMCVRENTARAASVEFVRHRRTNYARSRP